MLAIMPTRRCAASGDAASFITQIFGTISKYTKAKWHFLLAHMKYRIRPHAWAPFAYARPRERLWLR